MKAIQTVRVNLDLSQEFCDRLTELQAMSGIESRAELIRQLMAISRA